MEIKKAEYKRSFKLREDYFNESTPEIAVAGKSNVGKSSLINYLAGNSKLARVSKQPGKTRLINYFLMNDSFYLVDLPGYGFAKVSKEEKRSWGEMMGGYFETSPNLKLLIILCDIRHKPTEDDRDMVRYAETYCIPYVVVATKADKIAKSKRQAEANKISMSIGATIPPKVIPVSSELKVGADKLLSVMEEYLI